MPKLCEIWGKDVSRIMIDLFERRERAIDTRQGMFVLKGIYQKMARTIGDAGIIWHYLESAAAHYPRYAWLGQIHDISAGE